MSQPFRTLCCLLSILFSPVSLAGAVVQHDFMIRLYPGDGRIEVTDRLRLPAPTTEVLFRLHQNLRIEASSPGIDITPVERYDSGTAAPVQSYRVRLPQPGDRFELRYSGNITHAIRQVSEDYAGDLAQTPGLITAEGVYLSAASHWFPQIDGTYQRFSLRAQLPEGWRLISQGAPQGDNGWREENPQDDIYLVAAPYRLYHKRTADAEAMVYLRREEPATARRYLDATGKYLSLYSRLLGPYPYAKFALVENFWETGYGMPSFTLLGPRVIRLPFIIHSSYPHEILHNWWGNGVYPDYASGNWSEGLTSYLADHLLREQRGTGAEYRRTTLQHYADAVNPQNDFPLTAFRGRHGQASQAIGYGKTMMFFHMLRQRLGDETFIEGLRYFYKKNLFKTAGFDALRQAFAFVSKQPLAAEFRQWTTRTGAPALQLGNVTIDQTPTGCRLTLTLEQTQEEAAFRLRVPLLVQLQGEQRYRRHILPMSRKQEQFTLQFKDRPLRIRVDPQFDLFRRLNPDEIPRSLAQLFGAKRLLLVLPANATDALKTEYKKLADGWAAHSSALEIKWDTEIRQLPADRAVWVFGEHNRLWKSLEGTMEKGLFANEPAAVVLTQKRFPKAAHSFAIALPNPADTSQAVGWFAAHTPAAVAALGRKLPHYKKYSYLVFEGDNAKNLYKGKWPTDSATLRFVATTGATVPEAEIRPQAPLSAILSIN